MADGISIKIGAETGQAITGLSSVIEKFNSLSGAALGLNQVLQLTSLAFNAVVGAVKPAIDNFAQFETQLSRLKVASGASAQEIGTLKQKAEELGKSTLFNQTQIAEGLVILAKAGKSVSEQLDLIKPALDLATAGELSMEQAAGSLVDTMSQIGAPTSEATKMTDLFVRAANAANQSTADLVYAMKNAGGAFKAVGFSIEDTVLAISSLAEVGTKSGEAGVALSGFASRLAALQNATGDAAETLQKYGLTFDKINPKFHSFTDVISTLHAKHMSYADFLRLFGEEVARKLVNVVDKGAESLSGLNSKIEQGNTAAEQAAQSVGTVEKSYKNFLNTAKSLSIELGESLSKPFTALLDAVTFVMGKVGEFFGLLGRIKQFSDDWLNKIHGVTNNSANVDPSQFLSQQGGAFANNAFKDLLGQSPVLGPKTPTNLSRIAARQNEPSSSPTGPGGEKLPSLTELVKLANEMYLYQQAESQALFFAEKIKDTHTEDLDVLKEVLSRLATEAIPLGEEQFRYVQMEAQVRAEILQDMVERNKQEQFAVDLSEKIIADREFELKLQKQLLDLEQKRREENNAKIEAVKSTVSGQLKGAASNIAGVGGAIQGFETGGPIGAAVGALLDLIMRTKGLSEGLKVFNDTVVKLVEPVGRVLGDLFKYVADALEPLAPVIDLVADIISKFYTPLKNFLAVIKEFFELLFGKQKEAKETQAREGKFVVRTNGVYTGQVTETPQTAQPTSNEVEYGGLLGGFMKWIKDIISIDLAEKLKQLASKIGEEGDNFSKEIKKFFEPVQAALDARAKEVKFFFEPVQEALGAAAREINKVIQPLKEAVDGLVRGLNKFLTPAQEIMDEIWNGLKEAFKDLVGKIDISKLDINKEFTKAIQGIIDVATSLVSFITKAIELSIKKGTAAAWDIIQWVKGILNAAIDSAGKPMFYIITWFKEVIVDAIKQAGDQKFDLVEWIKKIITLDINASGVQNWNLVEWLKARFNITGADFDAMKWLQDNMFSKIKFNGVDGKGNLEDMLGVDIPFVKFHSGGLIEQSDLARMPGMGADEGLILAQAGERVISRDQVGSGGSNVVINMTVKSIDPRSQKEEIRHLLEELFLTRKLRLS